MKTDYYKDPNYYTYIQYKKNQDLIEILIPKDHEVFSQKHFYNGVSSKLIS